MATSTAQEAIVTLHPDKQVHIGMKKDVESGVGTETHRLPRNVADRERRLAWHCLAAYRNSNPSSFSVHVTGDPCSGLSASLQLSQEAVKMLPLLKDLVEVPCSRSAVYCPACAL